jgi:hypothetical protein
MDLNINNESLCVPKDDIIFFNKEAWAILCVYLVHWSLSSVTESFSAPVFSVLQGSSCLNPGFTVGGGIYTPKKKKKSVS